MEFSIGFVSIGKGDKINELECSNVLWISLESK